MGQSYLSHQLIQTLSRFSLIAVCRVIVCLALFNLTCASPVGVTQPYSGVTGSCEGTERGSLALLRKLSFMHSKKPFPAETTRLADLRCLKALLLTASHSPSSSEKGMLEQNDRIWVSAARNHLIPTPPLTQVA